MPTFLPTAQESAMQQSSIDLNGQPARLQVHGDPTDPPVLIVSAAVPTAWSTPAAASLAAAGFHVIDVDYQPPAGWEGEPVGRTCRDLAEDAVAALDHLDVARAAIVGISRGGVAAYWLGTRHPERVTATSLVVSVAPWADVLHDVGAVQAERPDETPQEAFHRALGEMFGPDFLAEHARDIVAMMTATPTSVVRVERLEEVPVPDEARLTGPVQIVVAEHDLIVERVHADRLAAAHPDARVDIVPAAKHGFVMEAPAALTALVAPFLRGEVASDA